MDIGILGPPDGVSEGRVLLTPRQAGRLEELGVRVHVQRGAGARLGVDDADWEAEGATVTAHRAAILERCEVVLSVARPTPHEALLMPRGAVLMGFYHLDVEGRALADAVRERGAIAVALERARHEDGRYPFRERMAEVAGTVCVQLAARLLESGPGPGVLLGGVCGLPPATVVVVGAGRLGRSAARAFCRQGAHVLVLDRDLAALEALAADGIPAATMLAGSAEIADAAVTADVLVGAIRVADGPPPKVLDPFHGKAGAVWLDLSIDEGGCIIGSRPVFSADEAYVVEGITMCPVPNLASFAARTSSRIASLLLAPALFRAAERGRLDLDLEPWMRAGSIPVKGGGPAPSLDNPPPSNP
jgi:alanine dehydrogenase